MMRETKEGLVCYFCSYDVEGKISLLLEVLLRINFS